MAKKNPVAQNEEEPELELAATPQPQEPIEMRPDQYLLWQAWCSILKHNSHSLRDTRLNLEICRLSVSFLAETPESFPVVIRILILDFDDDEVTATLTGFNRKSMRSQGEGFNVLRTATFHWTAPEPSFEAFLADFGIECRLEPPKALPPGYLYKGSVPQPRPE